MTISSNKPLPEGIDPLLIDGELHVCMDVPCGHCGYNLRTLSSAGACPECNEAVFASITNNELRFAPAKWLRVVALGAGILALAVVVLLVPVGASILRLPERLASRELDESVVRITQEVIAVSVTALAITGGLLLSTRDPRGQRRQQNQALRRTLRAALVVDALGALATAGMLLCNAGFVPNLSSMALGLVCTFGLGVAVVPLLVVSYVLRLGYRLPGWRVVGRARVALNAHLLALGTAPALGYVAPALPRAREVVVVWLVVLAIDLMLLGSLFWLTRRALLAAARESEGNPLLSRPGTTTQTT